MSAPEGGSSPLTHHLVEQAPEPGGPYSHAVSVHGLLFVSGQRPVRPDGSIADGVEAQAEQVMANLGVVLEACGSSFDRVVKTTIYLADIADFDVVNAVYRRFCPAPYPARTTVAAQLRGIRVEIDVVAALADRAGV